MCYWIWVDYKVICVHKLKLKDTKWQIQIIVYFLALFDQIKSKLIHNLRPTAYVSKSTEENSVYGLNEAWVHRLGAKPFKLRLAKGHQAKVFQAQIH